MKRSLILGGILVVIMLVSLFVTPSMANDTQDVIEHEIIDDQATDVYKIQLEVEQTDISEAPKIEENDETFVVVEEEVYIKHYTEDDIVMIAKLLHNECGGVASITERACVAWTVLNRVDHGGDSIANTITSPNQFAYTSSAPIWDELYWLAEDVLSRWNAEKNGEVSVGRVLPTDYRWFSGDGVHNYFRNAYGGNYQIWDYSLESPYES